MKNLTYADHIENSRAKLYHIEWWHVYNDDIKNKDSRFYDCWFKYTSYRTGRQAYDALRDIKRDCPTWKLRINIYYVYTITIF